MSQEQKQYQPKTVMWRNAEWIHNLSQKLGVADFDENFDNNFQMYRLILRIAKEVKEAIKQDVIKKPPDYEYPDKIVDELDAMWNGTCYFAISRDNGFKRYMYFQRPDANKFDEIIQLPKLKNLIPVGKISDDTLLIQIREPMPIKNAVEGVSYATLVNDGNYVHKLKDGTFPKIAKEDMNSMTKQIYYLARPVYNSFMDAYDMFFFENQTVLSINFQKLIDFAEVGGEEYEYEEEPTSQIFSE